MAPTLFALSFVGVAHAQGRMDFSGTTTLMTTCKTFAIYAGAVICFGGLIFAGIRMMSGRFQDAVPGLFGALFGAGVLGWGAGWVRTPSGRRSVPHLSAVRVHRSAGIDHHRVPRKPRLCRCAQSRHGRRSHAMSFDLILPFFPEELRDFYSIRRYII